MKVREACDAAGEDEHAPLAGRRAQKGRAQGGGARPGEAAEDGVRPEEIAGDEVVVSDVNVTADVHLRGPKEVAEMFLKEWTEGVQIRRWGRRGRLEVERLLQGRAALDRVSPVPADALGQEKGEQV